MKVTQASMRKQNYNGINWRFMSIDFEHGIWYYAHTEDAKKVSQPIKFRDIVDAEMIATIGGMRFGTKEPVYVFRAVTVDKERIFVSKTRENALRWVNALNHARDQEFQALAQNGLQSNDEDLSEQDAAQEVHRLKSENAWLEERLALVERQKEEELRMKEGQIGTAMQALNSVRRNDVELNDKVQQLRSEKSALEQRITTLEKEKDKVMQFKDNSEWSPFDTHPIQSLSDVHQASDERLMSELNTLAEKNSVLRDEVAFGLELRRGGGPVVTKDRSRDLFKTLLKMYDNPHQVQPRAFLISPHHTEDQKTLVQFAQSSQSSSDPLKRTEKQDDSEQIPDAGCRNSLTCPQLPSFSINNVNGCLAGFRKLAHVRMRNPFSNSDDSDEEYERDVV